MCDEIHNQNSTDGISSDITERYIFGSIIGTCNIISIVLCLLIIYTFYIHFGEYKKSAYFSIAFFMVLTDLLYQITIISTIVPISYMQSFNLFNAYETSWHITIIKNIHLLLIYFVSQVVFVMGIQRMSTIFNKSNCFTRPISIAIICLSFLAFDVTIIVLRRSAAFKPRINFKGLFIDSCFSGTYFGTFESIANLFIYVSLGMPVIVLTLFIITYHKLKKAKASIHIAEKNEAFAIENARKQQHHEIKISPTINISKNMEKLLLKYKIESEKIFLIQQMVLCITLSIGIPTTYIQVPVLKSFGREKLFYGIIRVCTLQISFSSLSICLVIFNKSIRDDIYDILKKVFCHC